MGSRGVISFPHVKLSPPHGGRWLCSCRGESVCVCVCPPRPASPQLLSGWGSSLLLPTFPGTCLLQDGTSAWPPPQGLPPTVTQAGGSQRHLVPPPPSFPGPACRGAQNRVPQVSLGLKSCSAISSLLTLLQAGQHSTYHTGRPWGQACQGHVPGSWVKPQPGRGREACLSRGTGSLIQQMPHPHREGVQGLEAPSTATCGVNPGV